MNNIKQKTRWSLAVIMLAASAFGAEGAEGAAKAPAKEKPQNMISTSRTFIYNLGKRMAIYEGDVRVLDRTLDLSCDKLTVIFHKKKGKPNGVVKPPVKGAPATPLRAMSGTGGNVKMLIAEGHVVIVNQANKTRALGDKAVYTSLTEQVELTSNPGRPLPKIIDKDGNVLVAKVIIYDRRTENLMAKQGVNINQDVPKETPKQKAPPKNLPEPPVRRLDPPKQ